MMVIRTGGVKGRDARDMALTSLGGTSIVQG